MHWLIEGRSVLCICLWSLNASVCEAAQDASRRSVSSIALFCACADTSLLLIHQIIDDLSHTLLFLFRSDISRIQIDRTAVHESIQRQKADQADPYSIYHSKALQAELRHLDAQERLDKQE